MIFERTIWVLTKSNTFFSLQALYFFLLASVRGEVASDGLSMEAIKKKMRYGDYQINFNKDVYMQMWIDKCNLTVFVIKEAKEMHCNVTILNSPNKISTSQICNDKLKSKEF